MPGLGTVIARRLNAEHNMGITDPEQCIAQRAYVSRNQAEAGAYLWWLIVPSRELFSLGSIFRARDIARAPVIVVEQDGGDLCLYPADKNDRLNRLS